MLHQAVPCRACHLAATGDGGHAGAQLMPLRNDASLAAAELALFVERAALGTGEGQTSCAIARFADGRSAWPERMAVPGHEGPATSC